MENHENNPHVASGNRPDFQEDETDRRVREVWECLVDKLKSSNFGAIANLFLAIFAAIGLFVYWGQWSEMRHTNELTKRALDGNDSSLRETLKKMQAQIDATNNLYREAQKQTDQETTLAENSTVQAAANKQSADAAQQSVTMLNRQFILARRPYISIIKTEFADPEIMKAAPSTLLPVRGRPLLVNIGYKNIGKSAAIHFGVIRFVSFGKNAVTEFMAPRSRPNQPTNQILEPERPETTTALSVADSKNNQMPNNHSIFIRWDGSMPIIVYGNFYYEDEFDNKYCTEFAFQYLQDDTWQDISGLNQTGCDTGKTYK